MGWLRATGHPIKKGYPDIEQDIDMNTTCSSTEKQVPMTWKTERDAKHWLATRLKCVGNIVMKEYQVKGTSKRIDYILQSDNVMIPIEVKRSLTSAAEIGKAAAQANDYARECGRPVFVGPLMYDKEYRMKAFKMANVGYARFNVGFIWCGNNNCDFYLGEKPVIRFSFQYGLYTNMDHYVYRESCGSKRMVREVKK